MTWPKYHSKVSAHQPGNDSLTAESSAGPANARRQHKKTPKDIHIRLRQQLQIVCRCESECLFAASMWRCDKLATCPGCNPNTAGTDSSTAAALSAACRVKGKLAAKATTCVRDNFREEEAVNPAD